MGLSAFAEALAVAQNGVESGRPVGDTEIATLASGKPTQPRCGSKSSIASRSRSASLSPALRNDLAAVIARIAAGDSISAQSIRAILANVNESIPEPNATAEAWDKWLVGTSGRALGNALVELSGEDDEYGVADQVTEWIGRYFKEVAAAPDAQSASTAASATRSA